MSHEGFQPNKANNVWLNPPHMKDASAGAANINQQSSKDSSPSNIATNLPLASSGMVPGSVAQGVTLGTPSPGAPVSSSISPPTNKCSYSIERILYQSLSSSSTNTNLKRKSTQFIQSSSSSSPMKFNRTTLLDDGKVPQLF